MFQVLLNAGADVDAVDEDGNTVLHIAAEENVPVAALKEIIKRTKDVNQCNDSGEAAIHKMVKFEVIHTDCMLALFGTFYHRM